MNEILELDTRRTIHSLISQNPGLHLSRIAEMLKMNVSLAEYHLWHMEKNDAIIAIKEGGYKRYYVKGTTGTYDKKFLAILRQETPLKIVLFLLKNPYAKHKEILEILNISPSTLSYYLKKLVKKNIVDVNTYGEEKGYRVINKKEITRILLIYKPYTTLEGFKDIWVDLKV